MSIIRDLVDGSLAGVNIQQSPKSSAPPCDTRHGLASAFRRLGADRNIRAVVLAGIGQRAYAGPAVPTGDLVEVDPAMNADVALALDACCDAIAGVPQPVVAAIGGHCLGADRQLSLACDFRFASPSASFEVPVASVSIVCAARSTKRLLSIVGLFHTKRRLCGADRIDAREATQLGFLDDLSDDPIGEARNFALQLSGKAPLSISGAKYILNDAAMGMEASWAKHWLIALLIAKIAVKGEERSSRGGRLTSSGAKP